MNYPNGYFRRKACRRCGEGFVPAAPSQLYCSPACRGMNSYYVRNYGITENAYEDLKKAQAHQCALCGGSGFVMGKHGHEKLCVDHCHDTGKVRGLLCHNCNRALGLLKDDPGLLRKAADYVEAHK